VTLQCLGTQAYMGLAATRLQSHQHDFINLYTVVLSLCTRTVLDVIVACSCQSASNAFTQPSLVPPSNMTLLL
jgi:hypothetical protein